MTLSYENAIASVISCGVGAQWWDVGMKMFYLFVDMLALTVHIDAKLVLHVSIVKC